MEQTRENAVKILRDCGDKCFKSRDFVKAIVYYQRCLEFVTDDAEVYNMLGYLYQKLAKYQNIEKQIDYYEQALKIKPDFVQALRNLSLTYPLVGRYDEAKACLKKIFEINPVVDDYVSYAYLCIKTGDFQEGWKYYEYRYKLTYETVDYPEIVNIPKWEGQQIKDKTLLVHYEQGFGDSLMFFRYLEPLKSYVSKIIFRVQDELLDLLKNNSRDIEIVGISTPIEDLKFDYHLPLLSLPYRLNLGVNDIPLKEGYIKPDETLVEKYKKGVFDNDCLKIGISWSGRKFGNRLRDIPLENFYPLSKISNVKLYIFQKGYGREQLDLVPDDIKMIDLADKLHDFSDTAAAMANLDLFITSDNALLNLAGAMSVKTFLLLNNDCEWRWMLNEKETPWYKSVEIFKKKDENDNWDLLIKDVIERVKNL